MDYEIVKGKMTGEKKRWKKNTLNSQLIMDLLIEFEKKGNRKRLLKLNSKWRKKEKLITEWNVELMYTQLYKLSVVYYGIESKEKRKMITTEKNHWWNQITSEERKANYWLNMWNRCTHNFINSPLYIMK